MCCAAVHGFVEHREVHHAQHLGAAATRSGEGASDWVSANVPSLPTSRCARLTEPSVPCRAARSARVEDVQVVATPLGAAPWANALRSPLAVAVARDTLHGLAHLSRARARAAACKPVTDVQMAEPSDSQALAPDRRCAPCCRRRWSGCRRSCCPPCRPAWPAHWWTHPPGTTGREVFNDCVQVVQHDARLHLHCAGLLHIQVQDYCAGACCGRSPGRHPPSGRIDWCHRRAARWAP
jgi:hypothetical protein